MPSYDGTSFEVFLFEVVSPKARVLVCHGYYANRYQVFELAHRLRQQGYEVLVIELRGHGQRPGPCTLGVKEHRDAEVALRWAAQRAQLPVGAIGWSMGGAIVCQLAARKDTLVRAVVTDSIYSELFPMIARAIRERYHLGEFPWARLTWWSLEFRLRARLHVLDPAALALHLYQPLLAIHAGADQRVPPQWADEFYQQWAGQKERWCEPKAGHVSSFAARPDEYCHRVVEFFDRTVRSNV